MPHNPKNLISNLSERLKKNNQLEKLLKSFEVEYKLKPRIGVEIEFYLDNNVNCEEFKRNLSYNITTEKGRNQYEIDLPPSIDIIPYINEINKARDLILDTAIKAGGKAILESKPYTNDYGSSMHFHVDFAESLRANNSERGKASPGNDGRNYIDLACNALCFYMLESFLAFMPNAQDYLRIDSRFMAPTNVSRGYNNRSVAIRIPSSLPKRIEHRVSSPLCDPYLVIFAILKAIALGIKNPSIIPNYPIIYGNAFDLQYNLTLLPKNIKEAATVFNYDLFSL